MMAKRTLTIGTKTWNYQVGRDFVIIKHPDGKRENVTIDKFVGRTTPGAVTPADIKRYIETKSL